MIRPPGSDENHALVRVGNRIGQDLAKGPNQSLRHGQRDDFALYHQIEDQALFLCLDPMGFNSLGQKLP